MPHGPRHRATIGNSSSASNGRKETALFARFQINVEERLCHVAALLYIWSADHAVIRHVQSR